MFSKNHPAWCILCDQIKTKEYIASAKEREVVPRNMWEGDWKICNVCGLRKHRSEYRTRKRGNETLSEAVCKECEHEKQREYRNRPGVKERTRLASKKRRAEMGKEGKANEHLQKAYGISLSDKKEMLAKNKNKCPICSTSTPEMFWTVDHCHRTGKIRDVICDRCNKMLGLSRDNPETLLAAYRYVLKHGHSEARSGICLEGIPKPDEEWEFEAQLEEP